MRVLSSQEALAVTGAGLFDWLFKKKTTVGVDVNAGSSGSTQVDVSSWLAQVGVCVTWGRQGGTSPCACGCDTPPGDGSGVIS